MTRRSCVVTSYDECFYVLNVYLYIEVLNGLLVSHMNILYQYTKNSCLPFLYMNYCHSEASRESETFHLFIEAFIFHLYVGTFICHFL